MAEVGFGNSIITARDAKGRAVVDIREGTFKPARNAKREVRGALAKVRTGTAMMPDAEPNWTKEEERSADVPRGAETRPPNRNSRHALARAERARLTKDEDDESWILHEKQNEQLTMSSHGRADPERTESQGKNNGR